MAQSVHCIIHTANGVGSATGSISTCDQDPPRYITRHVWRGGSRFGIFMGHEPIRGLGEEVFEISPAGSGRVRSGQEVSTTNGSGWVGSP